MKTSHYLPRALPESLQALATLALDLRWSWNHGADAMWGQVEPELWEATRNPWLVLETVSDERLNELADDRHFLKQLGQQVDERNAHFKAKSWFPEIIGNNFTGQIAYFSMEFGICESLPIYSGGLGVLAGDYLKTACDLNVPLIGVGLLYQQGYFRQGFNTNGEQIEFYPYNDPTMLPVVPLRDDNGEWVHITVDMPGRTLRLRSWRCQVGRRTLLLLDSNDPLNDPSDRAITSELYGGGVEIRLQQEIILGIGGWRLLEALGIDCPVCHLNEGHAAFAVLERARCYMQRHGQPFHLALRNTRAGNLLTTHTPVEAGFDRFEPDLFALYFRHKAEEYGISLDELMALGRRYSNDSHEPFNMATLAIRCAGAVNGVSRLHGEVSRRIFAPLFPRWPEDEVPIQHVTNGVHVPSWGSAAADTLWTQAWGNSSWSHASDSPQIGLDQLPDEVVWEFRTEGRKQLIEFLRRRTVRQHRGRGMARDRVEALGQCFNPDTLTLGFARRFATYKRPNLLLHDPQRLVELLTNVQRPVQLVLAGKAHPNDAEGKALLHQWQMFVNEYHMHDRIVFVEDYDLNVAEYLVQGVDVWINTPRRPWEASGTSGMKVLVNGGLNLSELDGWWAEAYSPEVGWALGDGAEHDDVARWDTAEALQLYQILEDEVVPCFYLRNNKGLATDWISRMRASMGKLTLQFSSNRMLREYTETYYLPLAESYRQRSADSSIAPSLEKWHAQIKQHWQWIHFGNVVSRRENNSYHFEIQVYLDDLPADSVSVELYAEATSNRTAIRQALVRTEALAGATNAHTFIGSVDADRPVSDYTPRIIPAHPLATIPLEAEQILWYH